jgi:signal peptidase II
MFVVLSTSVGCDQATKIVAIDHLKGRPTQSFLGDLFRLTYAENPGAFLGLGGTLPESVRGPLFTFGIAALLSALTVYIAMNKVLTKPAVVCMALMVGGGFGNLIDRIIRGGVVVDFMNMGIGGLRTGIFNVADVQLMVGAGVLALLLWGKPSAAATDAVEAPQRS